MDLCCAVVSLLPHTKLSNSAFYWLAALSSNQSQAAVVNKGLVWFSGQLLGAGESVGTRWEPGGTRWSSVTTMPPLSLQSGVSYAKTLLPETLVRCVLVNSQSVTGVWDLPPFSTI